MSKNNPDIQQQTCGAWVKANWLAALPLVGGFFKSPDWKEGLHAMGHYAFMFTGMMVGMWALSEIEPMPMTDCSMNHSMPADSSPDTSLRLLKAAGLMAAGMTVGEMCYNTSVSAVSALTSHCRQQRRRGKSMPLNPKERPPHKVTI